MAHLQAFGPYELAERIGVGSLGEVFRAFTRGGRAVALKRLSPSAALDRDVTETSAPRGPHQPLPRPPGHRQGGRRRRRRRLALHRLRVRPRPRSARGPRSRSQAGRARPARGVAPRRPPHLRGAHPRACVPRRRGQAARRGPPRRQPAQHHALGGRRGEAARLRHRPHDGADHAHRGGRGARHARLYLPERVAGGELDGRSDVYSLATCLWELCTGRRLFEGATAIDLARRIQRGDIPAPSTLAPGISPELDRILFKALAKPVEQRYSTADRFHADLSELARAEGSS